MDTKTQQLIIKILGLLAILSLIEVYILIQANANETITTQIILIASNIIGLLGGFISAKTLTEKQSETLNTVNDDSLNDMITGIVEKE